MPPRTPDAPAPRTLDDAEIFTERSVGRRSAIARVAAVALTGSALSVGAVPSTARATSDSDSGPHADPAGRGRPRTGVSDSDSGSNADPAGRGRGRTGVSDSDSGSNADPAGRGRGNRGVTDSASAKRNWRPVESQTSSEGNFFVVDVSENRPDGALGPEEFNLHHVQLSERHLLLLLADTRTDSLHINILLAGLDHGEELKEREALQTGERALAETIRLLKRFKEVAAGQARGVRLRAWRPFGPSGPRGTDRRAAIKRQPRHAASSLRYQLRPLGKMRRSWRVVAWVQVARR